MRSTAERRALVICGALAVMVLGGCGVSQSAVITVTSPTPVRLTEGDTLSPLPKGVTPKRSAEAVRQALLDRDPGEQVFLGDVSKLTVKLGVYHDPHTPAGSGKLFYVFSGGPLPKSESVCQPSQGGSSEPCYFIIAVGADDADATGGFIETYWGPS